MDVTGMSRYQEFCDSLGVGQAKTEEEQAQREDEEHVLRKTVGELVRRMCASFQCPEEQVRYVEVQAGIATGALRDSELLLQFSPEKGRYGFDLEIGVRGRPPERAHPVWVHLEVVPLKHGGLEFHFGSVLFQIPEEESAFFATVAEAINQDLRAGYRPGPRKIGF
jgi:hypothetical protein